MAITRDIAQREMEGVVSKEQAERIARGGDIGSQDSSELPAPSDFVNDRGIVGSANDKQIGGNHYKKHKFQHWDFVLMTGMGYLEGNATKYLSRWQDKNGLEDLEKPVHYIEKMMESHKAFGYHNPAYGNVQEKDAVFADIKKHLVDLSIRFCTENGILPIEARTIKLVTSWQAIEELQEAHELSTGLVVLVRQHKAGVLTRR